MPKINYNSRSLAMSKGRDINYTEENLLSYGRKQKELLEKKRTEKEDFENRQYSFHPTLIPSKAANKPINLGSKLQIHQKLYSQASHRQKSKTIAESKQEHSFKPSLIASSTNLNRPKDKGVLVSSLYKWRDELEQKIEEKRQQQILHETYMDEEGNRMFKPLTNSTDMNKHRNKDVFKYLYSLHSGRQKKSKYDKENNEFLVEKDLTPQVNISKFYNIGY